MSSGPLPINNVGVVADNKKIQLNAQSPRHLRDFWAVIMDTGAAISVCRMTFCEHIAVIPMGEDAKKQYVTITGEGLTIHGWNFHRGSMLQFLLDTFHFK
eukprot:3300996-Amphidinium_carterae.1